MPTKNSGSLRDSASVAHPIGEEAYRLVGGDEDTVKRTVLEGGVDIPDDVIAELEV